MMPNLLKAMMSKKLVVRKGVNRTGQIRIHFPNPKVQDIVLSNNMPVDVFGRINIQIEDVQKSNVEQLILRGDLEVV
jgi:hypothetical protein